MRIWLLTSQLPPEIVGGIARYADNFARLLGAAGHEVLVITRTRQAYNQQIAPNVRVIGLQPADMSTGEFNWTGAAEQHPAYPYNIIGHWPAFSYQLAQKVADLLAELPPPDIIESQEYNALPYYLLQRKLTERGPLEQIPIVVHLHSPYFDIARINQEPRYRFPNYWLGQMEKFSLVAADAVLAPSRFLACSVEQTLQRSLDIATIPYPFIINHDGPPGEIQPGHIVYVGRLELRKGVLPLIQACSQLWAAGHEFRLTLVGGDTPFVPQATTVGTFLRQRYSRWIEAGYLRLLGELDYEATLTQMQSAWAVVVPSVWDNFPNTCLEAMALGQVVLASQAGGQAEMIETDGLNGFIFDWDKRGDFEQKLAQVLALDPIQRQQIAEQAQRRIQALCAPEMVLPQRLHHFEAVMVNSQPRTFFPTVHLPTQPQSGQANALATGTQADLLSVIITYNSGGESLNQTLNSILQSTYTPIEVIIVHHGSTDAESLTVLQAVETQLSQQGRILRTEHQGPGPARSAGVAAARGEFIAFVASGDRVEPDFFTRTIEVLRRYANVTFVYAWVRHGDASAGLWPTWNAEFPYLLGHTMLVPPAVLRHSAFLGLAENGLENETALAELESWIGLVEAGGAGVSLPFPLVQRSLSAESLQQGLEPNQQMYLYDVLTQRHAATYREWSVELFNLQNANGPGRIWDHPAQWVNIDHLRREIENQQAQIEALRGRLDSIYRWLPLPMLKALTPVIRQAARKVLRPRHRLWLKMQRQALRVARLSRQSKITNRPPLAKPAQLDGLKVLMVYPEMGAPTRYRITNQAAQMELLGMQPLLYEVNNAEAVEALAEAHLLYFHRVEATPVTRKLATLARQQRLPIIYDTDDLMWDPQIEVFCFLRQHWPAEQVDDFLRGVKRHAWLMGQADTFVVSNPFLAHLVQADFSKKVYLHKNGVSASLQNLSEPFYQARLARAVPDAAAPVTLAYFSGWIRAHQEDFEVALEPLRQILKDRPQARLKVVGYLNLEGLFPGCEDRIQLEDFVSWEKLPELISQVDINLAPLVTNPHRRCKSAVKFMEAALVGVPTVASNLEPYYDIQPGQTGFLASTPSEWYDCLRSLIDSPELRLKMGAAARRQVLSQDTVQIRAAQLREVIRQIIEDYYG